MAAHHGPGDLNTCFPPVLEAGVPVSPCPHMSTLRVRLRLTSSRKAQACWLSVHPRTSVHLDHLFQGSVSERSHVLRSWGFDT